MNNEHHKEIATANANFLNFLQGGEASYYMVSAADHAEEFGSAESVVTAIRADDDFALEAYVEKVECLLSASCDAQEVLEMFIDKYGYRDDMLNSSKSVSAADTGGWDDLLAGAYNARHSDRTMPVELRKNLRKLNVKGMT